jgi:mannose-6-phosphate isomerase-like protein (cupin superfamily)
MPADDTGIILRAGEGAAIALPNNAGALKVGDGETAGAYALVEFQMPPGPVAGPPAHVHPHSEAFYVIEGTMDFLVGERRVRLEAGGFALVPGGQTHTFANVGSDPARYLVLLSPAGYEGYFAEISALLRENPGGPPDMEHVAAIGRRYGHEFRGPPLSV